MTEFVVDAVLFDLDGTLLDSSASVLRAWRRVADRLQLPTTAFDPYLHGIPAPQVFTAVAPGLSAPAVAELSEWMLCEQAADGGDVVAMPGARELLAAVPADRWAVVTSGDRRLATSRIRAAGLPIPGLLVTADDVKVGKPDPACYLVAAARLGRPPHRCLVVEDAPAGIEAARRAAMPVLGVLATYPDLPGADAVVPALDGITVRGAGPVTVAVT